ncbi:MAG: DUF3696 domain-containing protein [Bacteroidales bacterium]|nr:DUF3696 domain-containing protein [Bacteroidales bacterium]
MITRLKLTNFKSHRNTELNTKPLTLITGVNNCGKSSILQALLLLRQSYKKGRLDKGLDLNEPFVSVGVGNDALYRMGDPELAFEFDWMGNKSEIENYRFEFDAEKGLSQSFLPVKEGSDRMDMDKLEKISLFNNDFQYLSANRWAGRSDFPLSSYDVDTERQLSLNNGQGELVGNFLHKYQTLDTYNYIGKDEKPLPLLSQVEYWESRISNGLTVRVEQRQDKNGFNVFYGSRGTNGQKSIEGLRAENIGFGVSYSLSVVVALLSARPGTLLLIENPEAHLHPKGQSELANLICRVAQHGVQVILETHSDHIVNGVLVNCKKYEKGEAGICKNNVAFYYLSGQNEKHESIIEEVVLEKEGFFEYQPKGFFDQVEQDRDYLLSE